MVPVGGQVEETVAKIIFRVRVEHWSGAAITCIKSHQFTQSVGCTAGHKQETRVVIYAEEMELIEIKAKGSPGIPGPPPEQNCPPVLLGDRVTYFAFAVRQPSAHRVTGRRGNGAGDQRSVLHVKSPFAGMG